MNQKLKQLRSTALKRGKHRMYLTWLRQNQTRLKLSKQLCQISFCLLLQKIHPSTWNFTNTEYCKGKKCLIVSSSQTLKVYCRISFGTTSLFCNNVFSCSDDGFASVLDGNIECYIGISHAQVESACSIRLLCWLNNFPIPTTSGLHQLLFQRFQVLNLFLQLLRFRV